MREDVAMMVETIRRWALTCPPEKVVKNHPDTGEWTAASIVSMCDDPETFPEIIEYAITVHGLILAYKDEKARKPKIFS